MSTPLNVWFASQYFDTIPKEIEEFALIDGCNKINSLIRIILPLSSPAIVTMATITFLMTWNEFILGVIFINKFENLPYTVALTISGRMYQGTYDFGLLSAGAILGLTPVIIIFALFNKYLIAGITKGAIKM